MPVRAALALATLLTLTAVAAPAEAAAAPRAPRTEPPVAATPPMGFNDWNAFGCDVSAELIERTADIFVSAGLKDAGYRYVNIDDCWSLKDRGPDGRLVPDPAKFPEGIRGVADYVHARGLKLGIYGDAGTKTCAGYPGSLGVEDLDAQTWADWGVDYLKYDNCFNQSDGSQADFIHRYTAMREALDRTGRSIVYSISEWGQSRPWEWAPTVGNLWRTTGDISDNWSSIRSIIGQNAPLARYAGPGHWNDPDMLEIGNGGMTGIEYRSHMSMWAMMAAPLIIGTDLREATPETFAILGNRNIIAIDQDRLGVQGAVVSDANGLMVLDKPLSNGDHAIALYNSTDALATVSVPARQTGLRRAHGYRLSDVWTGQVLQARTTISAAVPAHGTVVYRVRPLAEAHTPPSVTVGAEVGTLVPGPDGTTLTTTVTNRGVHPIRRLTVTAQAPEGWTVTPKTGNTKAIVGTDAALTTQWTVKVPDDVVAGHYPIRITASYAWDRAAATSSEVIGHVVTAPAGGRRHLSTVPPVSGSPSADQSAGGSLITIGGEVYTRGLGTAAPSEILYYLGGRCSRLVTDVGLDDEAPGGGPATFTVYADDVAVASSENSPATLTADLTGADWLRLTTAGGGHADWAAPVLTCGDAGPDDPVQPVERTLFSFESGTDDFTIANPDSGGTVAPTAAFHTDGERGLEAFTPTSGNWYGARPTAPLDLTGARVVKVDVKTGATGTTGEIALQVGEGWSWCQGGLWAWTNPNSSKTVTERVEQINCPAGVTLDLSQVRAVWVFLNGGDVYIDNIRVE